MTIGRFAYWKASPSNWATPSSISPETIRQLLKKMRLLPWQHEQWCIPAVGAEFVAAMEDVLDLYEEEYDPRYPTVCFDEKLKAMEADV